MILILQPDTDKSSADYRQLMEYLSNLENITTRTHDEVGARQVLTEIYLVGDTAALSRDIEQALLLRFINTPDDTAFDLEAGKTAAYVGQHFEIGRAVQQECRDR